MGAEKIAITLEGKLLRRVDQLVKEKHYPSRSRAIQEAVREKLKRLDQSRLARETAKLDQELEQKLADEGFGTVEGEWPEY